jgi:hypothetical protein
MPTTPTSEGSTYVTDHVTALDANVGNIVPTPLPNTTVTITLGKTLDSAVMTMWAKKYISHGL